MKSMMVTRNLAASKIDKPKREPVKMTERMKAQLDAPVLRRKLSLDDLSDLEQHIKRLAVFLGASA